MTDETDIPSPVRFNPFKHHRNFILHLLLNESPESIINHLDSVCNNYIDLYTGLMSPKEIGIAVIDILKSNHAFEFIDFSKWINSNRGFRKIRLNDGSVWVVRKSVEKERFIHLHPAHTGQYTIRFKGSTLKTVYLLKTIFSEQPESPTLEMINQVRSKIGLSPVKKLDRNMGILNCFDQFFVSNILNPSILNR